MKKLLYITDLSEYIDHSFVGALFENYLKKHIIVDIVYFTEFKSDFEKKDEHRFVVPSRYKSSILKELNANDIAIDSYSYVIVRNDIEILKHVVQEKNNFTYKTGFRMSFPKRRGKLKANISTNTATFFDKIGERFKNYSEMKLINECDIFLPTSSSMQEEFFPEVTIKSAICPPCIDPLNLIENIPHEGTEKRFFYAGTLDKLREFETVLEAFSSLKNDDWSLMISSKDPKYALEMVQKYKGLEKNVKIRNAKTKEELLTLIATADIGVALLPNIPIYNTSTPIKVLDYYTSTVPCLMTNTAHMNKLFTDKLDAWFCKFTKDEIAQKLEYIMGLSKEEVASIGEKGQKRLLEIRNFETVAQDLANELESL